MDFAQQLAALDAEYEASEAFGNDHPEGKYQGEIKVARIEEYEGTLNLNMQVKTEKGMAFPRIRLNNHPSENSMSFNKGQLQNLGHKGRLSEVPNILHTLIGAWVEITVSHEQGDSQTFVNVNIRKLIPAPSGQATFDPFNQVQAQQPVQQAQQFAQPAQAAQNPHADIPFDAAGNPVPVQQPVQQQPASFYAAPVQQQPQSVGQAIAQGTPPAAPNPLPFQ